MELSKLSLLLLLIFSISSDNLSARSILRPRRQYQRIPQDKTIISNIIDLDLCYDISIPGETFRINFVTVLPETIPDKQRILGIKYSPKPSRIFNTNGNRYAEFIFVKPERQEKVIINIKAELQRYDLSTAREQSGQGYYEDAELRDFLRHERYIEKDNAQIQEIAETIEGQTQIETVRKIYNYVVDNMDYTSHKGKDWGAVNALKWGKGDCTEYSDLFVALCRAKDIPARFTSGYTVRFDNISPKHNWVEVFLDDYGWVPFDPSWGDIDNFILRDIGFNKLRPIYLYLTNIRNDEVLNNYQFAGYTYWGDRARIKDTIEFKKITPTFRDTQ